jgi:hypothetical protein
LGVANIQASMVSSYFDLKRENFGIFLRKLLIDDIIPSFKDEMAKEHELMFAGSSADMDRLDEVITRYMISQASYEYAEKTGFFPSEEEVKAEEQRIRSELSSKKGRYLKIPEDYYRNAKFYADVITTGEQIDVGGLKNTLMTAMQLINANPAVLQDQTARSFLFKILELSGASPVDLELLETQAKNNPQQTQLPQGGSIASVPASIANPTLIPKKQIT